jgi:uncharacterized membrane protein YraQ (UPF0718 family)
MEGIAQALTTGFGMLWKALWALIFGYIISAAIQVVVSCAQMAKVLGARGPRQTALASFFGFISSSCSFAALAASRSVLSKGAHATNAVAFLIASTNLVIELGIVLWVLLDWRFTLANFLLGCFMIVYAYGLMRLYLPTQLAKGARQHAQRQQQDEMHGAGECSGSAGSRLLHLHWLYGQYSACGDAVVEGRLAGGRDELSRC